MRFLDLESPLMRGLTMASNLILLNWLFILCSLPIVTLGASLTALHCVVLQIIREQDTSIVKSYFTAFRGNFRQATGIWLALLAVVCILVLDARFGALVLPQGLWTVVMVAMGLLGALCMVVWVYAFALQARYANPVRQTLRNALWIGIGHLPQTILLCCLSLAVPYLCYQFTGLIPAVVVLSMFILFSGLVYLGDLIVNRIFVVTFPQEMALQQEQK